MNKEKVTALVVFVIMSVLWLVMVAHGTWGFASPSNTRIMIFDAVHALIWAAFLYSAWRVYSAFRNPSV